MRKSLWMAALAVGFALSSCQGGYSPQLISGHGVGYSDTQIDDNTFEVRFDGNGAMDSNTVWAYWIYRCAQLTHEKGHLYFTMVAPADVGWAPTGMRFASFDASEGAHLIKVKGGGGHSVTTYSYLPGGSFTTWHSKSMIQMFDETPPNGVIFALDAATVMSRLDSTIQHPARVPDSTKADLLQKAQVRVSLSPLRGT